MGILADQFRAHLERLQELDKIQQDLVEKLQEDVKRFADLTGKVIDLEE